MWMKSLAVALFAVMTLQAENRVFELRTYIAPEGKLENLLARFRDHTIKLFEKHGMQNIGYWVPKETPNTLIYIVAHKSPAAAKASWDAFRSDPDWVKARTASEANGKIVDKVTSVFMDPVDFSRLK
jgi:hypothetical protein